MTNNKLKVGDEVKVVDTRPAIGRGDLYWDPLMDEHLNQVGKIKIVHGEIGYNAPVYTVAFTECQLGYWVWQENWIEPVVETINIWAEDLVLEL